MTAGRRRAGVPVVTPATRSGRVRPALLQVRDVSLEIGARRLIDDASLQLVPGEIVGLVGPNGSGKTTLLRIAAGLIRPTAGEVRFRGVPLPELDPSERAQIGVLGHAPLLYEELTAFENLRFWADLARIPVSAQGLRRALNEVGLRGREDERVGRFSRGMQQRLELARLLMPRPSVLLLDEPLAALDEDAAGRLLARLVTHRTEGGAALLAFHQIVPALPVCDRVLVLRAGAVVEEVTAPTTESVRNAMAVRPRGPTA